MRPTVFFITLGVLLMITFTLKRFPDVLSHLKDDLDNLAIPEWNSDIPLYTGHQHIMILEGMIAGYLSERYSLSLVSSRLNEVYKIIEHRLWQYPEIITQIHEIGNYILSSLYGIHGTTIVELVTNSRDVWPIVTIDN